MASWAQNSRPGGIWGGPGGLLEAILNDVGSKLACLGSCWSYVATFLAARWMAAKMAILAIKSAKMSQDGAQEAAKLS